MRLRALLFPYLLACALASALPAGAATISGVSMVKNAGNTADFFDNVGPIAGAMQSTVAVSSTSNSFDARYAAVVSADRGGSGGSGTTTHSFTGNFTITLSLTETLSTPWSFTLDVLRVGAQTIVSDGSGNASVALGALTFTETGAGSVTSGSQNLAALTTLSNAGSPATSPNTPFSQTAGAVISGTGTGSAQSIVLNYIFTASATSVDPASPGGDPAGDEAALRMGLDSALGPFTADNYPGVGLRNINTDGVFILFRLVEAPEPGSALLMGLGLGLLAWRRRAHR